MISFVCRDKTGHVLFTTSKNFGNNDTLVTEVLAIQEHTVTITIIQKQLAKVITESDSLVAIKAINGDINPPSHIGNLVEDIKIQTRVFKNIKFVYCSRSANGLVNMITKKAHMSCT